MKLNILGYSYTLDKSKSLDQMEGDVGNINFDRKLLQIANDLDKDQTTSVILHEIIEGLNYHLELNLAHPQIMALEVGLNQVLTDCGMDFSMFMKED